MKQKPTNLSHHLHTIRDDSLAVVQSPKSSRIVPTNPWASLIRWYLKYRSTGQPGVCCVNQQKQNLILLNTIIVLLLVLNLKSNLHEIDKGITIEAAGLFFHGGHPVGTAYTCIKHYTLNYAQVAAHHIIFSYASMPQSYQQHTQLPSCGYSDITPMTFDLSSMFHNTLFRTESSCTRFQMSTWQQRFQTYKKNVAPNPIMMTHPLE